MRSRLVVPVVGGPSGSGLAKPGACRSSPPGSASPTSCGSPPVGQEQLADWYRAASVLVMPSYSESFGLVAIEAQACGTPSSPPRSAACRWPSATASAAFLVTGHDPVDYARALRRFLEDPDLATRMGADAAGTPSPSAGHRRRGHRRRLHRRDAGAAASPTIGPWLTTCPRLTTYAPRTHDG
ncbi:glycosyltransferase [Streptomyces endophytica]|uniref:Glycosyltransferase n=1 Tax=Streptomyces endophytica TaxID=2991496 RepID=A0ABY6PJC9_9ACTN|nr:glycosyltransferase [Streptomyces endophytica]UZJ33921.1 glycosyltransferase [Streptomyces endophytica]